MLAVEAAACLVKAAPTREPTMATERPLEKPELSPKERLRENPANRMTVFEEF